MVHQYCNASYAHLCTEYFITTQVRMFMHKIRQARFELPSYIETENLLKQQRNS